MPKKKKRKYKKRSITWTDHVNLNQNQAIKKNFFSELPDYLEYFVEESIDLNVWKDKSTSYMLKSKYVKQSRCVATEKSGKRCEVKTECVTQNCWKHGCDIKSK